MKTLATLALLMPLIANALTYSTCPYGGCQAYTATSGVEEPTVTRFTYVEPQPTCTPKANVTPNIDLTPYFTAPWLVLPTVYINGSRYKVEMVLKFDSNSYTSGSFTIPTIIKR